MEDIAILATVVFAVSVWNTSVGPSGAVTFATMAATLPPFAVVPIHAVVESISGVSRAILLWKFVNWKSVVPFVICGLIGFVFGVPMLDSNLVSDDGLRCILGVTILIVAWVPFSQVFEIRVPWPALGGFLTSFLTLFIGATSPLVSALINQRHPDHREMLGTSTACMVFQHTGKVLIFGLSGFSFSLYFDLLSALILASLVGTWIGRNVLIRANQQITKPLFKTVVTILGIYLLWKGLS